MDILISLTQPLEPHIELDGGYACCQRCFTELKPKQLTCPKCNQVQDWSWLKENNNV